MAPPGREAAAAPWPQEWDFKPRGKEKGHATSVLSRLLPPEAQGLFLPKPLQTSGWGNTRDEPQEVNPTWLFEEKKRMETEL